MFRNVLECSGMFRDVPCSWFYRRPVYIISRAFVSCLGCQHFISDWLGKLKSSKLSTGCQNEFKGAAVEKATNPGRRFLFFSRLRRSCARLLQNRHATQAKDNGKLSRLYLRYCISARNQKWSPHFAHSCYPVLERATVIWITAFE